METPEPIAEEILNAGSDPIRVRHLSPGTVRITHAEPGSTDFPADRPWLQDVLGGTGSAVRQEEVRLRTEVGNGCLRALTPEGNVFFEEILPPGRRLRRLRGYAALNIPAVEFHMGVRNVTDGVRISIRISPGESFYGLGEWFNGFRRDRGRMKLDIRDAISLIQHKATYSGIPVLYSSRGYAVFLLNSHRSHWDLDPARGILTIEAEGPPADYILIHGPSVREILSGYTALTGRPPLLPRWAFGLWVTSYPQGHQDGVVEHVREHRKRGIPLDAVILDYHWEEGFHNFRWRKSLIPDPDRLISSLRGEGVRLGLITTPFLNNRRRPFQKLFLNTLARNLPPGLEHDDERVLPEYEEALGKGYLAHPDAPWWFGRGGMMDFTDPGAASWWNGKLRPLYDQGTAFFKNDDGEYLPYRAESSTGIPGREYHNLYGLYYGRAMYEGMKAIDDRRPLIYARSVWAGSQRYPAVFLGDQKPTFENIARTMRAGLNLGLLGFAYWTADVFGLDGKTTPETHMRYAQWALLSPVARYFQRPAETDDTRFPWAHGPQEEANFRTCTELRYRLLPYYCQLSREAFETGLPLIRPLLLRYPEDARFADTFDQVLLGDQLMICPVLEPGALSRRILLPGGTWHDFWTEATWQGPGEIAYLAPLERLPILVRGGGLLPMGPVLQSIGDSHRFDCLEFHLWPPYSGECRFYDDDGRTRAYLNGAFSITRIHAGPAAAALRVDIDPAEGEFPEQAEERTLEFAFHRMTAPGSVTVTGGNLHGWKFDQGTLRISLTAETSRGARIEIQPGPGSASG